MKSVSVQCRGIGLSYGTTEVLKDVNLDIAPGEFFALLGPSGSGNAKNSPGAMSRFTSLSTSVVP